MNILLISNHHIAKGKATEGFPAYIYRVAKALSDLGHKTIIVACGNQNQHYYEDEVEIYVIPFKNIAFFLKELEMAYNHIRMSWQTNRKIREICKERKIDIIQFSSIGAMALLYYGRVPAILRLSSYAKTYYSTDSTISKKQAKLLAFMERESAKRCAAVFAPANVTAKAFSEDIKRSVAVIETPFLMDTQKMDDEFFEEKLRDKKYALFFGKMIAEKGIMAIADSMYRFLEQNKEYYFVFCGEAGLIRGKNAKQLIKKAAGQYADRVLFSGALPHESLYPVIMNADFVTLPSTMENFSNACIEAMYLKKIVIGTDGASFEQLIKDGKSGFLCKIDDAESLLEKMNQVVNLDSDTRKEIETNAKKRIELLNPEIVVKKLLRFYEYVLKKGE